MNISPVSVGLYFDSDLPSVLFHFLSSFSFSREKSRRRRAVHSGQFIADQWSLRDILSFSVAEASISPKPMMHIKNSPYFQKMFVSPISTKFINFSPFSFHLHVFL